MKERELREASHCAVCEEPFGRATTMPLFYRVRVQLFGLDMNAIKQQDGLTAMLGGHAMLASVMGTNAEMASEIGTSKTFTVCHACAMGEIEVARLHELGSVEAEDAG